MANHIRQNPKQTVTPAKAGAHCVRHTGIVQGLNTMDTGSFEKQLSIVFQNSMPV
jgi:hypothetical protein